MNEENPDDLSQMDLIELRMEYVLYQKKLTELIKPGQIYTEAELIELIEAVSFVSSYDATITASKAIADKIKT